MAKVSIGIGSTNPAKLQAAEQGIRFIWQKLGQDVEAEFRGLAVESGVAAQPFSDAETKTGAHNRAQAVLDLDPEIQLACGLEGGVYEDEDKQIWSTVWVCILDRQGQERLVNGMRFMLPAEIQAGLRTGKELGDVMDELTQRTNVKHSEGMIGVLTGGAIPRGVEYQNLVRLAFALWWQELESES